jgi:hypothetical protein
MVSAAEHDAIGFVCNEGDNTPEQRQQMHGRHHVSAQPLTCMPVCTNVTLASHTQVVATSGLAGLTCTCS